MNKKLFNYQLLYRRTVLLIYDMASVVIASFLAIAMRYEFEYEMIPDYFIDTIIRFLPVNLVLTIIIFYFFRLYNSLWAFAGETELQNVIVACFAAASLNGIGLNIVKVEERAVPNSFYFMYVFVLISFIFASRFS